MASNVNPGQIPAASLLHGSQAAVSVGNQAGGKALPAPKNVSEASPNGAPSAGLSAGHGPKVEVTITQSASAAVASSRATDSQSAQSIADSLNKHLNDSGRPAQFRVDPQSGNKVIQEINPANGEVIGEFSIDEFPALARSVGVSGLIIDDLA